MSNESTKNLSCTARHATTPLEHQYDSPELQSGLSYVKIDGSIEVECALLKDFRGPHR
jgi:hypothetical protein